MRKLVLILIILFFVISCSSDDIITVDYITPDVEESIEIELVAVETEDFQFDLVDETNCIYIEDFYTIDKDFVDTFYDRDNNTINYDNMELNYEAYPSLEPSFDINTYNIHLDKVPDIRPIFESYEETINDLDLDVDYGSNLLNLDYHAVIDSLPMSEIAIANAKRFHPELECSDLSSWTNGEFNEFLDQKVLIGGFYNDNELRVLSDYNVTYHDAPILIKEFGSIISWDEKNIRDMKKVIENEYQFKIMKCKQYLAFYSIYKVYGIRME